MNKYLIDVISEGVAIGDAVVLNFNNIVPQLQKSIAEEKAKINIAFKRSLAQLNCHTPSKNEEFLQVHCMLLMDPVLKNEIYHEIEYQQKSAEEAIQLVFDKYIESFLQSSSTYLQERYLDFLDIKQRLLRNICLDSEEECCSSDVILVVEELLPSLLLDFKVNLRGVICKKNGFTSHGAILCRSLGIPCVVLKDSSLHSGDKLIIDTRRTLLVTNPLEEDVLQYKDIIFKLAQDKIENIDHSKYQFLCNISSNSDLEKCFDNDFDGIGLYRTEFIFMNKDKPLDEEEQYRIYKEAVIKMKDKSVCFRTFDVGDDKTISFIKTSFKGIKNYHAYPELFSAQIKALLRANVNGKMKIMFPMIYSKEEYLFLRDWVMRIKNDLNDTNTLQIGMMLETEHALETIKEFGEVDFISLGTNDLTKDLYHISRDENISYNTYIDDLIERLKTVVLFCSQNNIALSVCGELAAIHSVTKKFIEIGIKNFSVSPNNIKSLYLAIKDLNSLLE